MKRLARIALLGILSLLLWAGNCISKPLPDNIVLDDINHRLVISAQPAEGLYNINELKTIYLQFSQSNWQQLLTANYNTKADLAADLTYEGTTYKNVGVRFRGQTSYQNVKNSPKKSFNISVDYLDSNQRLMGYKTLNLNNCFDDPSFMREALYTYLAGNTIPTAKTNFVLLVINGENWGVYSNVQQINKDFYEEWFIDAEGTSWRAEYPDTSTAKEKPGGGGPGGGPGGGGPGAGFGAGQCSLNYMSDTAVVYSRYYTLKSTDADNPWDGLAKACYMLNKLPSDRLYDSLKYYLDVDRSLWHIANEIVFTDDDGYVNKGGMDYYVYYDLETGRLQPIDFDGNSTFTTKNVNWSPFLKETDAKFPLINRLLSNPALKQRYAAHVRSIINNVMDETSANSWIDNSKALIDASVQADSKKLYTYSQFTASVNELKTFLKNRKNNLLNNAMIKAEPPVIASVGIETGSGKSIPPMPGETAVITTEVNSASGINKVLLYYGEGLTGVFSTLEMFDDGAHGDGEAGDGKYGASIPGFQAGAYVRYYIEAIASNSYLSATYSPEGAEHDVYFYQIGNEVEEYSPIVINEIMASNTQTIADPQGDYDDWIELFNKSTDDVNLTGWYMSDKLDNPRKWQFPDNTIIKAGEYLIVWADEDSKETPGVHTNFKLSAGGEIVMLINSDANNNTIIDSAGFGALAEDKSYGRYPNGVGAFTIMSPTPGSLNELKTSTEDQAVEGFSIKNIYPNPFYGNLSFDIEFPAGGQYRIGIYDLQGRLIDNIIDGYQSAGVNCFRWDATDETGSKAEPGVYLVKVQSVKGIVYGKIILLDN